MDVLVAVGASVAAGVLTARPSDYAYWHRWTGWTFFFSGLTLLLCYCLAGLAGFVVFQAVGPGESSTLAAAFEGLAGHTVLRAQVDVAGIGDEPEGRSLLGGIRRWIFEWLDGSARARIGVTLDRLSDAALIGLSFQIFWEFVYSADPTGLTANAEQHEQLRLARVRLESGDTADARANLRGYCIAEVQRQRLLLEGLS